MTPREQIVAALGNANVQAILRVIRHGESDQTDAAYYRVNGRPNITSLDAHPYHGIPTTRGGRAAGAYQFLGTTWARLAEMYPKDCSNFGVYAQDFGAVALIAGRGALDEALRGDVEGFVQKCRQEWTSLPGATENSGRFTMEKAKAVFQMYHGTSTEQPAAPIEDRSTYAQEEYMAPLALLSIFGPIIAQLIPQVTKLFDKKTETPEKIAAAQTVIDTIVKSTSSLNAQEAVEKIQTDPAALKEATKAVLTEPSIMSILEVGGGVIKAREHDIATMQAEKPFWQTSAVFWISILLLPIVYWLVGSLIIGGVDYAKVDNQYLRAIFMLFGTAWNGESRSGGFNLVIGLILGGICGVYYGVSVTQNKQQQQQQTGTGVGG